MSEKKPEPGLTGPETLLDDRTMILAALALHGCEAGQYNVLGPDPWQLLWSADRGSFVAFLEGRKCLLSWRSPVARAIDQPDLLARLVAHANNVDKPLFLIEVGEHARAAGVELGMTPIWTGTESFLDLPAWSVRGGRRQKVRWARSHAAKLGLRWREAFPFVDAGDCDGMQRVERQWKEDRHERRTDSFLRTSFNVLADIRRYFVCDGPGGILAFVTCTPVSHEGWYLQDIVRSPEAPLGALEGAMSLALDTFRDEEFAFASNGPLPFWRPHDHWSDPHELGAIGNGVIKFFDRQYRFAGINQFRSKFEPDRTIPLYVLRSRRLVTPNVAR
jgi:lysylphosphatidylglycerol synthetase-like protein (DUF2156 family)